MGEIQGKIWGEDKQWTLPHLIALCPGIINLENKSIKEDCMSVTF